MLEETLTVLSDALLDPVGWERETVYQRRSASPSRYLSKLRDQYDLQFDDQYRNQQHRRVQYPSRNGGRLYRNRSFNHLEQSKAYRGHMVIYFGFVLLSIML